MPTLSSPPRSLSPKLALFSPRVCAHPLVRPHNHTPPHFSVPTLPFLLLRLVIHPTGLLSALYSPIFISGTTPAAQCISPSSNGAISTIQRYPIHFYAIKNSYLLSPSYTPRDLFISLFRIHLKLAKLQFSYLICESHFLSHFLVVFALESRLSDLYRLRDGSAQLFDSAHGALHDPVHHWFVRKIFLQ